MVCHSAIVTGCFSDLQMRLNFAHFVNRLALQMLQGKRLESKKRTTSTQSLIDIRARFQRSQFRPSKPENQALKNRNGFTKIRTTNYSD